MKKLLLSAVTALSLLSAASFDQYPNSITTSIGYMYNSEDSNLEDGMIYSVKFNQNIFNANSPFAIDSYQVALDVANFGYSDSDESTNFINLSGNLMWYFNTQSNIAPYFLLGAGVNVVGNAKEPQKSISLFTNAGAGAELMIRDNVSLIGEAKYMYMGPKRSGINTNVGLKFSYGD